MTKGLELAPNHFVDNANVRLDDANHLSAYVLIHIVGDGNAGEAVADEGDGYVYALQEALGVDATEHEAPLVQRLGALRRGADADGWEGVANGGEVAALLGQGTGVRDHAEGVHLEAVVIVEAEGLVLDDARVKLEAGSLETLARTRVARVQDRHIILLRHFIDGRKQRKEVLLGVDVLLPVRAQKNILALLKPQPGMNVTSLNLGQIVMQHFRHRRASHVSALLGQPSISQVAPCML